MEEVVKIEFTWREQFAIDAATFYANDMKGAIDLIINSLPYRICLWDCYNNFKIGNIPDNELSDFWQRSFEWQPEEINDTVRKGICKCIYLLGYVFEKYFV